MKYIINSFLLNLGKKIGLDLPYFVKNGFWIAFRYLFIGLFGLAISIGFVRLGTKEILGQYQFVINVLSLLSIFSLPGLNVAALKGVANGNDGVVKKAINLSFITSFLGLLAVSGYGIYNNIIGNYLLGRTFILAGILFPFFYAPNTWYTFYEGRSLFKSASIRIIANNFLVMIFILAGLYLKVGLFWLVFFYFGINAIVSWSFYAEILKRIKKIKESIDIKYGISCTIQKFTYNLSETVPALIISFIFKFEALAIYQVAFFLVSIVMGFISALSATYSPLLFRYKKLNYFKIIFQNLLVGFIFYLVFILIIKLMFFVFYSESYRESYNLALSFSFIIILIPLRIFLLNYFTAINRNKLIIVANIFANAFSVGVFYLIKNTGFSTSVVVYFYLLNLLVILPLLISYFLSLLKK